MTELVKTIKDISRVHPASNLSKLEVSDLIKNLMQEVEDGYVSVQEHPEYPYLKVFKYTQSATFEKKWNKYTLMARGLIVDTLNKEVVANPFVKFFNYNELININDIFEKDFVATEKMDGSMGILFFFDNRWMVSTLGSFTSEQAIWANKYLANINCNKLIKGNTYLLEIVYPENRIVVPYTTKGLFLLSIFEKGKEISNEKLDVIAKDVGFKRPKTYDFKSLDNIVNTAKNLDFYHEGFVIRFRSGIRVKIKGDEYCKIHRLIAYTTPLSIWRMMLDFQNVKSFRSDLPEEIQKDFDQIVSILEAKEKAFWEDIKLVHERTKHMSDKDLGLLFQQNGISTKGLNFAKSVKYIFPYRKDGLSGYNQVFLLDDNGIKMLDENGNKKFITMKEGQEKPSNGVASEQRKSVFRLWKPEGNILEGYEPTNVMNRFTQEADV